MAETVPIVPLARVPTGIAGLDQVTNGGLLSGGAYIVQGVPGTGKTTLGTQISFRHVAAGGRVLYVTLLAESHARMMQHMSSFDFFAREAIGHTLFLVSAFELLEEEKLKGVLGLLTREVIEKKISLLVSSLPRRWRSPISTLRSSSTSCRRCSHSVAAQRSS